MDTKETNWENYLSKTLVEEITTKGVMSEKKQILLRYKERWGRFSIWVSKIYWKIRLTLN